MYYLLNALVVASLAISPAVLAKGQEIYKRDKPVKEKVESKRGHVKEGRG